MASVVTLQVQIILKSFLEIKKTMHKYYELTRAKKVDAVLQPVFNVCRHLSSTSNPHPMP